MVYPKLSSHSRMVRIWREEAPKGGQEEPKESTGSPKEAQVRPKGGPREPKGPQRGPREAQGNPPGDPKEAKRAPRESQ